MPISKYNPDGTVDIFNKKTGEVRTGIRPETLGSISPSLVAEYQMSQSPQATLERKTAEAGLQELETGEGPTAKTENVVNQLESLFFGEGRNEPLAVGEAGFGGRLPGVVAGAERAVSPGEPGSATERLNTYIRTLESVRPQLAKAAGDSGNIAFQEQPTDTPTEAIELMQSARLKFGLERSPELDRLKEQIITEQGGEERVVAEKAVGPTGEFKDRGFLEKLFATGGIQKYISEGPGIALEGVKATGQNIADLLGGDIESAVARSEEFKPQVERVKELDEAAREEIATKLETVAGIQLIKSYLGPKLMSIFKGKSPELIDKTLKQGAEQIIKGKEVRNAAIEEAQSVGRKVNGTKVFNSIEQWADDAIPSATPSEEKGIRALLTKAQKFFNGKNLNPQTAKRRWDTAVQGFKDSGKAGDTIKAGYHRAIRDGVRQELDEITNGAFEEGTRLIHEGLNVDKLLSGISKSLQRKEVLKTISKGPPSFARKVATGALETGAKGLGLYAVAKALGLQFPGAAYSSQ